ncbi:MAG TPA: hypothetical protein VFI25_07825 [Planctomycetota bacterium]|jgi:hypothetical protein|nr:hypothetical protein [Planctomycetota bacterium]
MNGAPPGSLFLLELGFGLSAPLLLVRRAPLGPFFFRLLGGFAAGATVAGTALLRLEAPELSPAASLGALLALVASASLLRPLKTARRSLALGAAAGGSLLALAAAIVSSSAAPATGLVLSLASSFGSGLVVGTVAVAMALGHWYLVVPNLDVAYLRRANIASAGAIGAKLAAVGALVAVGASELSRTPLFRPMGLFHLGTRGLVGLLAPLGFAALVAGCLRYRNTRSATGILYASTVLVLIGEAVGLTLWGSYGIPL